MSCIVMCWYLIVTVAMIAALVFCIVTKKPANGNVENFGYTQVTGNLARYNKSLNDCFNACEAGNNGDEYRDEHNCLMKCQTILTEVEKKQIPPSGTSFDQIKNDCAKTCNAKKLSDDLSTYEKQQVMKRCNDTCTNIAQVEQWCSQVMCIDAGNYTDCMRLCPQMMNPAGVWRPHPFVN